MTLPLVENFRVKVISRGIAVALLGLGRFRSGWLEHHCLGVYPVNPYSC